MAQAPPREPETPSLEGIAPPFASRANATRRLRIALDSAAVNREMPATGTWLYVVEASSRAALARVEFNEQRGDKFPIREGLFLSGLEFNVLWIENTAQAGEWLDILFGVETQGNVRIVNPTSAISSFELTKGTTFVTPLNASVGVAAASVLAAFAGRREALLQSDAGNAGIIYVGHDATVGPGRGLRLDPGQSLVLSTSDDIFAEATIAAQTLRIGEIRD